MVFLVRDVSRVKIILLSAGLLAFFGARSCVKDFLAFCCTIVHGPSFGALALAISAKVGLVIAGADVFSSLFLTTRIFFP